MATDLHRPAGAPSSETETDSSPPRLASGIELVGQFEDSGFKDPPYIARRKDGQVIQLPHLLYVVAEHVDGSRDHAQIAERVTEAFGRELGPDDVGFLLDEKLRPLGVVAPSDGPTRELPKADPLLALKFRTAVIPDGVVRAITSIFRPLFFAPVVGAIVAGFLALDGWLFFEHGVSQSIRSAIYQPAVLLLVFGGVVLATAFHEIGHATACRYGGAKPGVMGVGIYVVWPAFYTDVTDAYRLGKAGRLRTDLGGVYFNAIFALVTAGIYFATGFEPLLLLVLLQNFAIIQQLLPLLRLDGYYIISDLTGVPDMLSRLRPTLASLLPGRPLDPRVEELKPWVRKVVAAYVLTVVPVLLLMTVVMLVQAPRLFATAYDSLGLRYDQVSAAVGNGHVATALGGLLQSCALVVPLAGMVLTTGRVGRRAVHGAWSWSAGEPGRRAAVVAPLVAAGAVVVFLWWPNGEYRPIQRSERGTVPAAVESLRHLPTGRPALTSERGRQLRGAPGVREEREDPRLKEEQESERREAEAREREQQGRGQQEESQTTPVEPAPTQTEPTQTTTGPQVAPDASGQAPAQPAPQPTEDDSP